VHIFATPDHSGLIGLSFCLLIEDRSGLLSYALLGMFLVPLRNIRFGHLVALVVSLVSMAALCMPPRSARHSVPEQAASAQHSRSHSVDVATYVVGVGLRVEGLLHDAADGEPFQQWPLTLAMIILGFLVGREPRFKVLWTCAGTLRTHIAAPALAGELIGTIFAHAARVGLVPLPETAMNVIDVSAMVVLSVSYTIWLLAILQRPVADRCLGPLAAAGRMALSNYMTRQL
jgi:uncharacterized membrane protein YeiB